MKRRSCYGIIIIIIICANFRWRTLAIGKETSREKSLLWFAEKRWLFAIYLEVDSNRNKY